MRVALPSNAAYRARSLGSSALIQNHMHSRVANGLRSLRPGSFVAGPAYPVACNEGDNLALHFAVERAPAGSVLVVTTPRDVFGYWDSILTAAAQISKIAGLVIEGYVRETSTINQRGFPVFSLGSCPKAPVQRVTKAVGEKIILCGVPVDVGDFVVADDDGVVLVSSTQATNALSYAEAQADKEVEWLDQIQRGHKTVDLLGLGSYRDY